MTGDEELLVVGVEHLLHGLPGHGGGEQLLAQLIQRHIGDSGHPLGGGDVPGGAGGGLEHDGVGDNGGSHQTRQIGGRHQSALPEHIGDDGVGGAHRLVAHIDGVAGLDIRQTVVVDDGQNLRLLQTGDGLGGLVVIHQNHPLFLGAQQMIPGHNAYNLLILVQNGVAGFPVLQHHLLGVVHPVIQMEAGDVLGAADPGDGGGLEDHPRCPVGIEGGGDDAGLGGVVPQLLGKLALAQHQHHHILIQRGLDHIRLVAADDDAVRAVEGQGAVALGQGDEHLAGDGVQQLTGFVEDFSLQNRQNIEQGHLIQMALGDKTHVVVHHTLPGEHTKQGAVIIGNGQGGVVLLQNLPGPVVGDGLAQHRGRVKIQIPDLVVHIVNPLGGLEAEAVQHHLSLVGDDAQTGGLILPVADGVVQGCIGDGSHNGIGIRISMSGDIDWIHSSSCCM